MTPERIEEIAARLNAATKGPWKFKEYEYGYSGLEGGDGQYIFYPDGYNDGDRPITWLGEEMTEVNRVMIENAPDDIRDLLAEVRRQKERVEALEKVATAAKFLMEQKVFTWDAVTDEQIHKVITDVVDALADAGVGGGE